MIQEYWSNKKILITGGTGFIGTALTSRLREYGADVYSIGSKDCNLEYRHTTDNLFGTKLPKLDFIFHAAAWTMPGDFCLHHSAEQFLKNTLMHVNVLEAWKVYQSSAKLIGVGSSCSYPGNLYVLKESDYWNGNPHESLHSYAMTKRMLYAGQLAYEKQYGLRSIHVIFATVYGAGDYFDDQKSHCASALIKRFCEASINGDSEVVVWGDGNQEREFVYIDDQINGLLLSAQCGGFKTLINLGAGKATKIKELVEIIARHCNYKGKIIYDTTKFIGIERKVLDSTIAEKALGWKPEISLDDGIKKTIEWYYKNRKKND